MCIKIDPSAAPWRVRVVYKVVQLTERGMVPPFSASGSPCEYRIGVSIDADMRRSTGGERQAGFHVFKTKRSAEKLARCLQANPYGSLWPRLAVIACAVSPSDCLAVGVAHRVTDNLGPLANATYAKLTPLRIESSFTR